MEAITGISPVRPAGAALGVRETSKAQQPEEAQGRLRGPGVDTYAPGEKQEAFGRYWIGKDEEGQPKVYFDGMGQDRDVDGPKKEGQKEERCQGNTDRVDREIEKLKRKQEELEQRLRTENDAGRARDLERQLAQVERELRQKDNDTYRRQHSTFTQLP